MLIARFAYFSLTIFFMPPLICYTRHMSIPPAAIILIFFFAITPLFDVYADAYYTATPLRCHYAVFADIFAFFADAAATLIIFMPPPLPIFSLYATRRIISPLLIITPMPPPWLFHYADYLI